MSHRRPKRPTGPPETAAAGLFEPEDAPADEVPAAAGEGPGIIPAAPSRVRFPLTHHTSFEDGCFHVLTEPDHPLPRLVLAHAIDCLHPEQLPTLAAVLIDLLRVSRPKVAAAPPRRQFEYASDYSEEIPQ